MIKFLCWEGRTNSDRASGNFYFQSRDSWVFSSASLLSKCICIVMIEVEAFFHAQVCRMFYRNFYMRLLLNCIIWISNFKKHIYCHFFYFLSNFFSPCLICSKLHNIGNMKKCWAWERMILHAFFNGVLSDDLNFIK